MDKNGGVLYQNSGMNAQGLGGVMGGMGYAPPSNTWNNLYTGMGVKPDGPRQQDPTGQYGFNSTSPWTNVNGATFNMGNAATSAAGGAVGGNMSGGGYGGTVGGFNYGQSILDLLAKQDAEHKWAVDNNVANWNMARDRLIGVENQYNADPTANATRGMVNNLLANPEAINDQVQSMIQNRAANQIAAQQNNQARQGMGVLGAAGQLDAGSILAMQERLGRGGMAQKQNTFRDLEVQRANQRNQDIQNAIAAGQRMSQQDNNVRQTVASELIRNLPQYQARDLSGTVAALAMQQAATRPTPPPAPMAGFNPSPFGYNAGAEMWSFGNGAGGGVNYSDIYGDRLPQSGGYRDPVAALKTGGVGANTGRSLFTL